MLSRPKKPTGIQTRSHPIRITRETRVDNQKRNVMDSTTTASPEWMIDCDRFIKTGHDFEVHEVINVEDLNYLKLLCATYDLHWSNRGSTFQLVRQTSNSRPDSFTPSPNSTSSHY
jgi:hypothetical protein